MLTMYLHFNGNCREAFEFYRSVFGGEFQVMQAFRDGPSDMGVPDADQDLVMHVQLPIGESVLMGSDVPTAFAGPVQQGSNFSISYTAGSREETDDVFARLSAGGTVTMALQDMFWGSYFGSCTDRFGIGWMVSYDG